MTELSALKLNKIIRDKKISVKEALQFTFENIKKTEENVHSFVTIDEEYAYSQAKKVQKKVDKGEEASLLAGVPIAIKDNICTKNMRTTCSSKMLENYRPVYNASVVERLEKLGAIIIGKTNMDEFAMGSTTETSYFGSTKNPWNLSHVSGGSSGGSCAAVAANECFFALGSDTGGSIRQPSAYCGVTGMKPTYGTISRYGLIAYASSLDQIGPITKNVEDCATVLQNIAFYDIKDSSSIKRDSKQSQFTDALKKDVKGMKIGIPKAYLEDGLQKEIRESIIKAGEELKSLGAIVEECDLKLVDYAIPAYYTIATAEASSNLARYDGVKYGYRSEEYADLHQMYKKTRSEGFQTEVKSRIMLGSFVLSSGYYEAYYLKALKTKRLIKQEFDELFKKYDVLLGPTAPTTAPKQNTSLKDPLTMYLSDIYTVSANLCGLPAITIPYGTDKSDLPIGIQFIGNCFEESKLITCANITEKTRNMMKCPLTTNVCETQERKV